MIFSRTGIPRTHINCSFSNFISKNQDSFKNLLIQRVLSNKEKGVILIGSPGVGKTHLLVATYFQAQQLGFIPGADISFFDWQEYLNWIRSGFSLSVRADLLITRFVKSLQFLILDDIRPEPRGSFWREILELTIEVCYSSETIFLSSSNADDTEDLIERWQLTDYHSSRLLSMVSVIALSGQDHRLK